MRWPAGFVLLTLVGTPLHGASAVGPTELLGDAAALRGAVVKVFATVQGANEWEPWNGGPIDSHSGSGVVLEDRRILTAAHVVTRQTVLQVRRHGETRKHDARVLFVSHEADLALLTVDDPAFFERIEPIALGTLPPVGQEVLVLGYPAGGDTLSTTKGVVSRIEHQAYTHSNAVLLAGQIDAPVNPGNSGGPVLVRGCLAGMVMQSRPGMSDVSYFVPAPVLLRFLEDVADGRYDGVPGLGFHWQALENGLLSRICG
jgi:S1-C subfamily serine protease